MSGNILFFSPLMTCHTVCGNIPGPATWSTSNINAHSHEGPLTIHAPDFSWGSFNPTIKNYASIFLEDGGTVLLTDLWSKCISVQVSSFNNAIFKSMTLWYTRKNAGGLPVLHLKITSFTRRLQVEISSSSANGAAITGWPSSPSSLGQTGNFVVVGRGWNLKWPLSCKVGVGVVVVVAIRRG